MEEQRFSLYETLTLYLFLACTSFLLARAGQIFVLFFRMRPRMQWRKAIFLLALSQVFSFVLGMTFWLKWPSWLEVSDDFMVGPILLPALAAEVLVSPVTLWFLGGFKGRVVV